MKKERCYVMIKPDGIQRSLVGEIIGRIEKAGLKIIGMKMMIPTKEQCEMHYNKDDAWFQSKGAKIVDELTSRGMKVEKEAIEYGRDIVRQLVYFMTSGPVVGMIIEGNQSVGVVKKLVGGTEPTTSDVGTIRGDYTIDSYALAGVDGRAIRNLIHCTDNPAESAREIDIWFQPHEILSYRHINEAMLYDNDLEHILAGHR